MSFTFFSAITLTSLALMIFSQVYRGYKKGITSSLITLAIIVLSAFFAVPISRALAEVIEPMITKLLDETEVYRSLLYTVGNVSKAVVILLRMLVSLLLYYPVFVILRAVLSLLLALVLKLIFRRMGKPQTRYYKENEELYVKRNKRVGAFVGIASGLLLTVVTLTPLLGVVNASADVIEIVANLSQDDSFLANEEIETITECSDDITVKTLGVMGSDMLCDFATTVKVDGYKASLMDEIAIMKSFDIDSVNYVLTSLGTADENSARYLEQLLAYLKDSVVLKTVLIVYVNDASSAWMRGEAYMDIPRPTFGNHAAIEEFLNVIFYVCSTSTLETIDADITTLMNLSKILSERSHIFAEGDYETVITELLDSGVTDLINMELEKNPHMRPVSYAIADMVMTIVTDELKNSLKYTDEDYDQLIEDFTDVLAATQGYEGSVRATAVSKQVRESLEEYGENAGYEIYVPEELDDIIADLLINGVTGTEGNLNPSDVQKFMDQYGTGTIPGVEQ